MGYGNTGGSSHSKNDVAGASIPLVRADAQVKFDSEDFCRAVRRCLIKDLAAADREDHHHHHRKKRCWF